MARKKANSDKPASDDVASYKHPATRKNIPRAGLEHMGERGIVEEEAFAALSGWRSLPFPRPARLNKGEKWRGAVKVLDPRRNEGLRVVAMS